MRLTFNQRIIDWAFDPKKHLWHIPAFTVRLVACLAWFVEDVTRGELEHLRKGKR